LIFQSISVVSSQVVALISLICSEIVRVQSFNGSIVNQVNKSSNDFWLIFFQFIVASRTTSPVGFFAVQALKTLSIKISSSHLIHILITALSCHFLTSDAGGIHQFQEKNLFDCIAVKIASTKLDFHFQLNQPIIFQSHNSVDIASIFLKSWISI